MTYNPGAVMGTCVGVFGEAVEYRPQPSGTAYSFRGIFNEKTLIQDITTGSLVLVDHPTLGVKLSDLSSGHPKQGDRISVRGTEYRIEKIERDGEAGAVLVLMKVS